MKLLTYLLTYFGTGVETPPKSAIFGAYFPLNLWVHKTVGPEQGKVHVI